MRDGRFALYGNPITKRQTKKTVRRQNMFIRKFSYDPNEKYLLSLQDNNYLGEEFGIKDILRNDRGEKIENNGDAVIISTIRMGFGHYRIAMAGASCAKAMGFTPYWLDLLAIPGITTDVINYCNTNYSWFSRLSQRSAWFNKHVWKP